MAKVKVFRYVGQMSRSLAQKSWLDRKGLIARNVCVKYESCTFNSLKVTAKVKVFRNVVQRSRSISQYISTLVSFERVLLAEYT